MPSLYHVHIDRFLLVLNGYKALQKKKRKKKQEFQLDLSAPSSLSLPVALFKTRIALLAGLACLNDFWPSVPLQPFGLTLIFFFFLVRPKLGTCVPLTQLEQQPLKPQVVNITEISPVFGTINR